MDHGRARMRDENIEAEKGSSFIPAEFEILTATARNPPTTLGIASPMSIIRRIRPRCTPLPKPDASLEAFPRERQLENPRQRRRKYENSGSARVGGRRGRLAPARRPPPRLKSIKSRRVTAPQRPPPARTLTIPSEPSRAEPSRAEPSRAGGALREDETGASRYSPRWSSSGCARARKQKIEIRAINMYAMQKEASPAESL